MASTNSHHHASIRTSRIVRGASAREDVYDQEESEVGRRSKRRKANLATSIEGGSVGWPSLESLKPTFVFLCFPLLVVLSTILMGGLPKPVLYLSGLVIGIIVAMSTFKTAEITVVCILLYLPFAKTYVIPVLPGLNGTNMLIMLAIGTAAMQASREKIKFVVWPPGSKLVLSFAFYTGLSAFTVLQHPGGADLLKSEILSYKSWLDQFIIYWLLVAMIRDKDSAKRAVVYLMIGSMAVVVYSVPEMLEKMGRSSIEKSRMIGPQMQSNNFGGFVAYSLLPLISFLMVYIKDIRAWLVTPYFILAFKVLITTFSRGAYLAIAAGGLICGYYRGRVFLMGVVILVVGLIAVFPAVIPESISARMGGLIGGETATAEPEEEKLDKSSSTRIVMWEAATDMMIESPMLGKGFKGFEFLKHLYTKEDVHEKDPHSMYFYIGSQMGIPSLIMFFMLMGYMFKLGRFHSKNKEDMFIRAVGIAGTGMPICYGVICIFGSRATALNFTIYFWAYLIVLQVFKKASNEEAMGGQNGKAGLRGTRSKRQAVSVSGMPSGMALGKSGSGMSSGKSGSGMSGPGMSGSTNAPQQGIHSKRSSRSVQRVPRRGAAAVMLKDARDAEDNLAEAMAQIEIMRAARVGTRTTVEVERHGVEQAPYETRAARRAREAANEATAAAPRKRLGRL